MGQYHIVVNLDKKEYLHPHRLGDGLKLMEFALSNGGTMSALAMLLAAQNGRGGGDFREDDPKKLVGSWAGDRIAVVGDYADEKDAIGWDTVRGTTTYNTPDDWVDRSADMRVLIEADGCFAFSVPSDHGMVRRTENA